MQELARKHSHIAETGRRADRRAEVLWPHLPPPQPPRQRPSHPPSAVRALMSALVRVPALMLARTFFSAAWRAAEVGKTTVKVSVTLMDWRRRPVAPPAVQTTVTELAGTPSSEAVAVWYPLMSAVVQPEEAARKGGCVG